MHTAGLFEYGLLATHALFYAVGWVIPIIIESADTPLLELGRKSVQTHECVNPARSSSRLHIKTEVKNLVPGRAYMYVAVHRIPYLLML